MYQRSCTRRERERENSSCISTSSTDDGDNHDQSRISVTKSTLNFYLENYWSAICCASVCVCVKLGRARRLRYGNQWLVDWLKFTQPYIVHVLIVFVHKWLRKYDKSGELRHSVLNKWKHVHTHTLRSYTACKRSITRAEKSKISFSRYIFMYNAHRTAKIYKR